jgi:hypothetical protein
MTIPARVPFFIGGRQQRAEFGKSESWGKREKPRSAGRP